jgi:hypothetical protein
MAQNAAISWAELNIPFGPLRPPAGRAVKPELLLPFPLFSQLLMDFKAWVS